LKKIKVGAVSYLNTKPLLYGIKRSEKLLEQIVLVEEYPSKIASMLVDGSIDIGLVPVAVIPQLKEWHIVSDYCIGADGDVGSVCLFSEVSIDKIEKVLLDYQSKTSVNLGKILLKNYWKISPQLIDADENYIAEIKDTTAGIVIGDRALQQRKRSKYIYDLAAAWKDFTGLSFVFAAWISNRKLPDNFIHDFNEANNEGLKHIDDVIAENPYKAYDLNVYYKKNISYFLDEEKKKGMEMFLKML
jgi:chorismate dehydratase